MAESRTQEQAALQLRKPSWGSSWRWAVGVRALSHLPIPSGTALRGVTIHPPLRTAPVVRGETARPGGGRAAVSVETCLSRAGGGRRVRSFLPG